MGRTVGYLGMMGSIAGFSARLLGSHFYFRKTSLPPGLELLLKGKISWPEDICLFSTGRGKKGGVRWVRDGERLPGLHHLWESMGQTLPQPQTFWQPPTFPHPNPTLPTPTLPPPTSTLITISLTKDNPGRGWVENRVSILFASADLLLFSPGAKKPVSLQSGHPSTQPYAWIFLCIAVRI